MRKFLVAIFVLSSAFSHAQDQDAIAWTGVGISLPITKKFELSGETQIRLDNNMSRLQNVYGEVGGDYELFKDVKAGMVYRYARKNSGDFFWNENRLTTYISYKLDLIKGLDLRLKTRHQFSFDRFSVVNNIDPLRKHIWRTSIKLDYQHDSLKLLNPFVSAEVFHSLSPKSETNDFLDTYRLRIGLNFDLPDRHSLKVFYMYEHENRAVDNNLHIYCIQWDYEIKSLWKWKKNKEKDD